MVRFPAALFLLLICYTLPAAAQVKPDRIRVSESVMQGMLIKKVDPQAPADAADVQGPVVFKAVIDKTASIESLELISGHPILVRAAIDAAKQWKYKPYMLNGAAMKVETTIRVEFPSPKEK